MIESVFSNNDFMVIHKTSALNFHTEDGEPGLFEQVKAQFGLTELYPVHRLDKLTTGLVIFAKTKAVAAAFGRLFESHQINKFYLAISDQKPKKKQGWVKGDMAKARRGAWKLLRSQDNPAITQFISQPLSLLDQPKGCRLFLLRPFSGKTHQIRVALKSVGSPIIGDGLYSSSGVADRGYLHAYGLQFTLNDQDFSFCVPPSTGCLFTSEPLKSCLEPWSEPWKQFT
ncbi:MAG: tRNA pseudouridine32 synthase/23S rRNA pseudouridine746 synthase [Phenylobacterium sp.]|jgi:tRNA pseudouridine32 synthase/23S rRNA pseudouridine746 synthase